MNTPTIVMFGILAVCAVYALYLVIDRLASDLGIKLRNGWIDIDGTLVYDGGSLAVEDIPQDELMYFLKKESAYLDHCALYPEDWSAEGQLPHSALSKESVKRGMKEFKNRMNE